jgi:hypothetical protein
MKINSFDRARNSRTLVLQHKSERLNIGEIQDIYAVGGTYKYHIRIQAIEFTIRNLQVIAYKH